MPEPDTGRSSPESSTVSPLAGVFLLFTALTVGACSLIYFPYLALRKHPVPTREIHLSEHTEIPLPPTKPVIPIPSARNWTRCDAPNSRDRYYCSHPFRTRIYDHPKDCHLEGSAESIHDCYRRLVPTGDREYAATWIRQIDKDKGTMSEPKRLKLYDCKRRLSGTHMELYRAQNFMSDITPKGLGKSVRFSFDYQLFPDPPRSPVTPGTTDESIFRHACASPEAVHGPSARKALSSPPA
jgi:hypothetical protein